MMLKMYILLLIVLLLPSVIPCPSSEKIKPCTCVNNNIYCKGIENDQVLVDVTYALKSYGKFYLFNIEKSTFMYLPHDIFKNTKFVELQITSSIFRALSDTEIAFEGLEDDLGSLIISDSEMFSYWDWNVLKHLRNIAKLRVSVGLTSVSEDVESIKAINLKDISFEDNQIAHIHDTAFAGFKELLAVVLRKNNIREVKRSMFPNPAALLWKLDLSNNEIEQLPENLFENMPSMETVSIENNKLLTLNEGTFKPVWTGLRHFYALDNPFRCDCRMIWITQQKFPQVFDAICEKPGQLAKKKLMDLAEKDLWCLYNEKA